MRVAQQALHWASVGRREVDMSIERFDTVVIGAGQAGLALGYYLKKQGRDFVIFDASDRVGASWRKRWDSLRLFTPAHLDSLPGLPFPAPNGYGDCPTKDDMADYLASYAARFDLPVKLKTRVDRLTRTGERYLLEAGTRRITAEHVVVATGPLQCPYIPELGASLASSILQRHASAYHNPTQLPPGTVLVVGAGNSGAEIALDLARAGRRVVLSGRDTGHLPGGDWACRHHAHGPAEPGRSPRTAQLSRIVWPLLWWFVTRALTADTRLGRKIMSFRPGRTSSPLIRLTESDLLAAGIERAPRTQDVSDGQPRLADGRVLDVAAVVWATGYRSDYSWIELPIFDADGYPVHHRGVIAGQPGLYFLGLPFQHTLVSEMIAGEVFDAGYVAEQIAAQPRRGF